MKFVPKTKADWIRSAREKKEFEQFNDEQLAIAYDAYASNVQKGVEAAAILGGDWHNEVGEPSKATIDDIVSMMI